MRYHSPRNLVAAYAADPAHATEWYVNIKEGRWKTPPPARVGSQLTFVAHFVGRTLEYTYEIFTAEVEAVVDQASVSNMMS